MSHIIGFVPFNRATFYSHKLEELEDIEIALTNNRIIIKQKLRNKLQELQEIKKIILK